MFSIPYSKILILNAIIDFESQWNQNIFSQFCGRQVILLSIQFWKDHRGPLLLFVDIEKVFLLYNQECSFVFCPSEMLSIFYQMVATLKLRKDCIITVVEVTTETGYIVHPFSFPA